MDGSDNALLWGVRIHFEQSQEEPWKMRQVFFNLLISLAALGLKLLHTYGIFIASSVIFPCGTWTLLLWPSSLVVWRMGLVAPRHVGS